MTFVPRGVRFQGACPLEIVESSIRPSFLGWVQTIPLTCRGWAGPLAALEICLLFRLHPSLATSQAA